MLETFKNVLRLLLFCMVDFQDLREKALVDAKRKVRESVNEDSLIINAINNIEELEKNFNAVVSRLREWFSLVNPEFEKKVEDNQAFVHKVLKADFSVSEMGASLSKRDEEAILSVALLAQGILKTKFFLEDYLEEVMGSRCKNVLALAGPSIGARLLREAGSLKRLASLQSGTIQLLRAEKALFRHIKSGAKPPKHGFILNHQVVSGAKPSSRGKASRALADKLSVCARLDFFGGEFLGASYLDELKEKFGKNGRD